MLQHRALVINILGGPGVGKTTLAASLFAFLKRNGCNVEYVQEYAKKLVWLERWPELDDQYNVSRKQYELLHAIADKVDCIVTDGPLAHGFYYVKSAGCVSDVTKTVDALTGWIGQFANLNIGVLRNSSLPYDPNGRYQNAEEAKIVDDDISIALLEHEQICPTVWRIWSDPSNLYPKVLKYLQSYLNAKNTDRYLVVV